MLVKAAHPIRVLQPALVSHFVNSVWSIGLGKSCNASNAHQNYAISIAHIS